LSNHRELFLALHFLGIALGMGGATVTDILFFNFLRDFTISKKEAEVMRVLSYVITGGIVLLFLSGVALYVPDVERMNASPAFLAKMMVVMVIAFNGILMHHYVAPRMVHLSFSRPGHPTTTVTLRNRRRLSFALGAISFTSWYFVFFVAMLKRKLPASADTHDILSSYVLILVVAISTSLILERFIASKARQR